MKQSILFRLFAVVTAMMCALGMQAQEAYACYTESNETLTFYYDSQRESRPGKTYSLNQGNQNPIWYYDCRHKIKKAVFNSSFANARPTTTFCWFSDMPYLKSITGLSYLNTSEVTYMAWMFMGCIRLTSVDVSHFDTSKVTSMDRMFEVCRSLTSLNVRNFDTSNVTKMRYMFSGCSGLTSLDISNFNTAKVTIMSGMFASTHLKSLNLSNFNTDNVTEMHEMFLDCHELTSLDISSFNTAKVTDMEKMFSGCSSLTSLDVSNFNTSKVTKMNNMFSDCSSLTSLDVSNFNTTNVDNLEGVFAGCCSLSTLDLSRFNTAKVKNMKELFSNCFRINEIFVSNLWNRNSVSKSNDMFLDCVALRGDQGTTYDANHVDASYAHIDGGAGYPGYFSYKPFVFEQDDIYYLITGSSNTVWVTYKDENYNSYSGEVTIPATVTYDGTTYTVKAIDNRAFKNCTGLTKVTIPSTVNLIGYSAFYNCPSLQTIECLALTPPTVFSDTFYPYSATVYVPRGSVENYADATYWKNFTNIVEIGGGRIFQKNGIYYTITGDNTVAVTYRSTNYNTYSGEVTIPETVTYNGTTYNVTAIGTRAFYNCSELTSVTIGSNVTAIGDEAFRNCTNLGTSWGWYLTIPDAVTTIGYSAFRNCNRIDRVDLGSGVTFIDNVAFYCDGLYTVVCSSPVPPRTDDAFTTFNYTHTDVYVPKGSLTAYRDYYEWGLFNKLYERPNYDFEIDGIYYQIQSDSTSVYVTRNYDGVEDETYFYTEQKYNIPETVTYHGLTYTVTGIDRLAFWYCTNLEHISLPKTIQEIGDRAFDRCTNLQSLYCHAMTPPELGYGIFDESVAGDVEVAVPNSAFSDYEQAEGWCDLGLFALDYDFEQDGFFYRITGDNTVAVTQKEHHFNHLVYKGYVDIPWRVSYQDKIYWLSSVYDDAFVNCRDLTAVNIPNTGRVRTIGNSAFMYCTGLKRVTIPQSVTTIKNSAFSGCTSLETITCNAWTPPTIYTSTFQSYAYNNATLRVPHGTKNSYQSKNYWKNFLNIEEFYELNEALNVEDGELEFESDGVFAWTTVEEGDRVYAVSGNAGAPGSISELSLWVYVEENSTLSFDFKAWGETTDGYIYDFCMFSIDGVAQFCYGALDNDWETYSVELAPGEHTLEWMYSKDSMVNPEGDYFAVDNVQIVAVAGLRGDVDGDGNVGIADVTALIDYILSGDATGLNLAAGDVDEDGNVGIADVTALIDYILSGQW